jgi:hypothetical protein
MQEKFGQGVYGYMPDSFSLPDALESWREAVRVSPSALWMLNASTGARGMGIAVVDSIPDSADSIKVGVAQRYVSTPSLIDGRKYHLRVYVAISSMNPLRVLMGTPTTGMMMVAAEKFTTDKSNFENRRAHLTNSAVGATVHPLADFWEHLDHEGVDREAVHTKIADLVVKAVFSAQASYCASACTHNRPFTSPRSCQATAALTSSSSSCVLECVPLS